MVPLSIQLTDPPGEELCGLCSDQVFSKPGLRLCVAATCQSVCRSCARVHAADLLALIDLAQVAEQVGRIGRHTLVPPLNALLDLNRAAEQYVNARKPCQQAG